MTYKAFCADEIVMDAVIRNLRRHRETARHVPEEIELRYPDAARADMRDMRNVVVHQYFEISHSILWDTLQIDLLLDSRLRDPG
jgi:uncharacterized protein with HEPN domain